MFLLFVRCMSATKVKAIRGLKIQKVVGRPDGEHGVDPSHIIPWVPRPAAIFWVFEGRQNDVVDVQIEYQ